MRACVRVRTHARARARACESVGGGSDMSGRRRPGAARPCRWPPTHSAAASLPQGRGAPGGGARPNSRQPAARRRRDLPQCRPKAGPSPVSSRAASFRHAPPAPRRRRCVRLPRNARRRRRRDEGATAGVTAVLGGLRLISLRARGAAPPVAPNRAGVCRVGTCRPSRRPTLGWRPTRASSPR